VEALPVVSATPYAFGQAAMAAPGTEDAVTVRRPLVAPAPRPAALEPSSPLPPPTVPARFPARLRDEELPPMRTWQGSATDEVFSVPHRRRVGGWVVAFVLVLAVGVVGWVVAKPYLASKPASASAKLDPRAQAFVADGEKALSDGNLDLAQECFDKASALAEHDARVAVDEARVAAAKTDVPWLKLRLLPAEAADEVRTTNAQLADRLPRVRKAADDAVAAAPEDPGAQRARVDALRLAGERDNARSSVSKIIGQASQPETAYVLAALDLAEPEPLWTTVIDRLRLAAAGEGNGGRARAALVYALAKAGDVAGAKAELAKLDAMSRPYPLLPNLHAFVDKAPAKASADGGVAANVPHIELSALPQQPAPGAGGGTGGGEAPVAGDSPNAMSAASQAIRKGDWARARQIYEALVSRNPNDSEALAGLGDCARAQGDTGGAISAYKRALAVNPSYLPALLGVADTQWASGDRGSAQQAYRNIVDRFPEGTYPAYVKSRIEPPGGGAETSGGSTTRSPSPVTSSPSPKGASSNDQDGL
jgi:tetratricopeptide (TPR) repeat protein